MEPVHLGIIDRSGGAAAGPYVNTTSDVIDDQQLASHGRCGDDTLDVTTVGTTFSKSFSYPPVPGGAAIPVGRRHHRTPAPSPGRSRDLDAVLTGLVATSSRNTLRWPISGTE